MKATVLWLVALLLGLVVFWLVTALTNGDVLALFDRGSDG